MGSSRISRSGFVASQQYFVSFMSGNTTRLSVDLVTADSTPLVPALLILGFVLGVTTGALLAHKMERWRKTAVIAFTAALIGGSAIGRASGGQNSARHRSGTVRLIGEHLHQFDDHFQHTLLYAPVLRPIRPLRCISRDIIGTAVSITS